jgi:hypothetical protein
MNQTAAGADGEKPVATPHVSVRNLYLLASKVYLKAIEEGL